MSESHHSPLPAVAAGASCGPGLDEHPVVATLPPRAGDGSAAMWPDDARRGIAHLAIGGRFLAASPRVCALLGRDEHALRQLRLQDVTHADDRVRQLELTLQLVAGDLPAFELATRVLHADGSARRVRLAVTLVREAGGAPGHFVLTLTEGRESDDAPPAVDDATASRATDAPVARGTAGAVGPSEGADALRAREARYRTLFETMDQGFCVVELLFDAADRPVDYRFLETNLAFAEQSGLTDVVGRTARALVPDIEAHWFEAYGRVARTGEPARLEQRVASLGRWFDVHAFRVGAPEARQVGILFTDVSARRRVELEREELLEALAVERDRLRQVFAQAPSVVAVLRGATHVFEFANQPYMQFVGDRPLVGLPVRAAFPELEGQGFFERLDEVLATGEPFVGRALPMALRRTPDGPPEERRLDFVYQPITELDGTRSGIVVQGIDVTEQTQARAAVEEEREQLARLVDALPVMVTVYDPALAKSPAGAVQFNRAFVEILGWSEEDARTGDLMALCYPDPAVRARAAAHMQAPLERAWAGDRSHAGRWLEIPTRAKDGRVVPVLWTNMRLSRDRQVGVGVDLTERKDAEAALAAERALLQAVLEQMPVGVSVCDAPSGAIVLTNPAGERLLGHPLLATADMTGHAAYGALHEDDAPYAPAEYPIARALAGETVDQHVMRYRRGDGRVTYLAVSAAPVYDADGRLVRAVCAWTDVHERVTLEAALRQARDAAEGANRTKSQFLATMSHELRTPLNAIQGHVQLVELGLHGPVTAAQSEALGRVQRAQRHLLGLINDILNYARLEAGKVEYAIEALLVRDVVADVLPMIEPQAEARGLGVRVVVPEAPLAVRADRDKMRQVLLNLLSNAVKFTTRGEITVTVETLPEVPDRVAVRVRDTGMGIPPDRLGDIFEPFVQVRGGAGGRADAPAVATGEGTGLGLAISRDLAQGMGGNLTVESAPGVGSTFTLWLRPG